MTHRTTRKKDERGAILILSAVGLVLAMIAGGLAVDLGFMAQQARDNQKVADMAALDAVRALPADPTDAARDSALRNGFTATSPPDFVVETGTVSGGVFTPSALADATAVRVSVMTVHDNQFPFLDDGQNVTRRGIASTEARAQFSVGSKLATVNPTANANLNRVMTAIFGPGSNVNLTAVGYQGLAGGAVSLGDLVTADPSLGTPDDLLTTPLTVRRLAQLSVTALNNKGDAASVAAATALGTFASTINSSLMVTLGDILAVSQPGNPGSVVAETDFNVFDLIAGAGMAGVSTGAGFVDVPGLTVSVAGLGATTLRLTVIEPPRISAFGPARYDTASGTWATTAETAQVRAELTTRITVGNCGFLGTCVDWRLPLKVSAAKATGSLTDVRCAAGSSEADIMVATEGANATSDNVLTVRLLGVPLSVGSLVSTNISLAGTSPPHPVLSFAGPPFPTPVQSTAATGAGLTTATQSQLTVLGVLPLGPVLDLLSPVTAAVDNQILDPIFDALGLSISGADVRTMRIDCGVPTLVG